MPEPTQKYILIAEDDRFYAHIFEVKLTQLGFVVKVVFNGDELIAAAQQQPPNLILLDLMMPVRDGFDTLSHLKTDPRTKDIKVVVTSSLAQEEDMKRAKELGAIDYFVKSSMSLQEMMSRISQYSAK